MLKKSTLDKSQLNDIRTLIRRGITHIHQVKNTTFPKYDSGAPIVTFMENF